MSNFNALLRDRVNGKKENRSTSKMAMMAEQSANGQMSGFAGVFNVTKLSSAEISSLHNILDHYVPEDRKDDFRADFERLTDITAEVKAINNQAIILHGERIKKAHSILTKYEDGAFTAWLMAAYGNRQTPYNLMQYYDFYQAMPGDLRPKVELMPKQAVYTLAARDARIEEKKKIVENFSGETKNELLALIRETFPLDENDGRKIDHGNAAIIALRKGLNSLKASKFKLTDDQKERIGEIVEEINSFLSKF